MKLPVDSSEPRKALPLVVTGLIAKHREIAGIIIDLQKQLKTATTELVHIEAALRIFKPDIDVAAFNPRTVRPRHSAFRGEASKVVLQALREALEPPTMFQLTEHVMKMRGLPLDDNKLCRTMVQRTHACLKHWRKRGWVRSLKGPDGLLVWEVSPVDQGTPGRLSEQ